MRVLFTVALIAYVIYRFYKLFFVNTTRTNTAYQRNGNNEPHVHRNSRSGHSKKDKSYEGGEYIDYEEIK
ncbi:MAG: hypothetical protein WBA74_07030 [Cyclobacteriaceae bacterium]